MGAANLCERTRDAQTARQNWDDCARYRPPPPLGMAFTGDLAITAMAPVVKSAAASANSIAAVLLQKSTTAAAKRAMLEVGCSTASVVAAHSHAPDWLVSAISTLAPKSCCQAAVSPAWNTERPSSKAAASAATSGALSCLLARLATMRVRFVLRDCVGSMVNKGPCA